MFKLTCSVSRVQERPRYTEKLEDAQNIMLRLSEITIKAWKNTLSPVTSDNAIVLFTQDGRPQCTFKIEEAFK